MAAGMARLQQLEDDYRASAVRYVDIVVKVEKAIASLENPDERSIIRRRYVDGMTWGDIIAGSFMSERTCYRLHETALKKLAVHGS